MTANTEESIVLVVTIEDYHRTTAFMPQEIIQKQLSLVIKSYRNNKARKTW